MVPLDRANVDTDAIVPKQFLKRVERSGYGQFLFHDWRFDEEGKERSDFVLNQEPYRQSSILVAGRNFGSGSSREHAPWALADYGIRVIVAPSFADIFHNNCFKNGLLPIVLQPGEVGTLMKKAIQIPGGEVTVDLEQQRVFDSEGFEASFSITAFLKKMLLEGLDDIDLSLEYSEYIDQYENSSRFYYSTKEVL